VIRHHPFFLSLFILAIFVSASEAWNDGLLSKAGIKPIQESKKAPHFTLEDLSGKKVELKYYKDKVILLNFWATWCSPCKEEMPSMEALYQQFKMKDFILLAVSVDYESKEKVKEFIEKRRYTFPVLVDPRCFVFDLYEVKGIPTTILINKKGMMIGRAVGPRDWKSPEVITLIHLLASK